ncbi:hypothetical protein BT63DRAFT_328253 [Microthyrium microscopicum]|uniref:SprT-like domain-containing protein n=1 Tax=Microthyrium microscopicum TaxID=703497 RepID=A0A6A6U657_9PEZI|nr:hypothetical protein BT63DRAFT_328253 [Microthyrium microscopicum]
MCFGTKPKEKGIVVLSRKSKSKTKTKTKTTTKIEHKAMLTHHNPAPVIPYRPHAPWERSLGQISHGWFPPRPFPPHYRAARPEFGKLSLDEATLKLLDYLQKEKAIATRGLFEAMHSIPAVTQQPEPGLYRVLEKLQRYVFPGVMGIKLQYKADDLMPETPGCAMLGGPYSNLVELHFNRLLVSRHWLHDSPLGRQMLFGVFLHMMIHAYFLMNCTPPKPGAVDERLKHENHFGAVLYKLKELCNEAGIEGVHQIRFAYPLNQLLGRQSSRPFEGFFNEAPRPFCSHCKPDVPEIDASVISKWIENDLRKSVDPEIFQLGSDGKFSGKKKSQRGNPREYVLFRIGKKLYMHLLSDFKHDSSLLSHIRHHDTVFELPKWMDEKLLKEFFTFFKTGTFGNALSDSQVPDGRGPPLINQLKPIAEWKPSLLVNVQMALLGMMLQMWELQRHAVERLQNSHITHEDPIAVIEALFNQDLGDRFIPQALIDWFTAWMIVYSEKALKPGDNPKDKGNYGQIIKNKRYTALLSSAIHRNELSNAMAVAGKSLATYPAKSPPPPPPPREFFPMSLFQQMFNSPMGPTPQIPQIPFSPFDYSRLAVASRQGLPPPSFLPPHMANGMLGMGMGGQEQHLTMLLDMGKWGPVRNMGDKTWECMVEGLPHFQAVWKDGKWSPRVQTGAIPDMSRIKFGYPEPIWGVA